MSSAGGEHGTHPAPGAITVRQARAGDVGPVFELDRAVFPHGSYPYFFLRQALDALPDWFVVAIADGRLVGYALGSLQAGDERGWVLSVVVDPAHQGRRIGRTLTEELMQRFEARGARETWLHVSPANTAAVALYQKLGFTTVREEPDYFGPGEHRLIMRRASSSE